jgi:hypothetical protein
MARITRAAVNPGNPTSGNEDDVSSFTIIEPGTVSGDAGGTGDGSGDGNAGDSGPYGHGYFANGKPRRRAPKGTRSPRATKTPLDIKALEGILLNIHSTLAALTRIPEFGLEEKEAEQLARSVAQVSRHYNVPAVAPYIIDHVNLVIALCAIYGPRYAAYKIRTARGVGPEPSSNGITIDDPQTAARQYGVFDPSGVSAH